MRKQHLIAKTFAIGGNSNRQCNAGKLGKIFIALFQVKAQGLHVVAQQEYKLLGKLIAKGLAPRAGIESPPVAITKCSDWNLPQAVEISKKFATFSTEMTACRRISTLPLCL